MMQSYAHRNKSLYVNLINSEAKKYTLDCAAPRSTYSSAALAWFGAGSCHHTGLEMIE